MIFSPEWFLGYDIVLTALFAIITILVAIEGFRIHRATLQRQPLYLAWSFLLIGLSKITQTIINFLSITKLNENICQMAKIQSINAFNIGGAYIQIFLMLLGLSTLAFMTLKTKEIRGLIVISSLALLSVFFNPNPLYMYYVISSLLLLIVSWYFIKNYLKNKKTKTLTIAIAFLFLLFGSFHFLVGVNHEVFYVIGLILELIAYGLVLTNFLLVRKR